MLIGVMADSHDNVPMVEAAVQLFNRSNVQHVLHAGDFVAPFAIDPLRQLGCPVLSVFGNNDGERIGLAARIREVGQVRSHLATINLGERHIAVVHYPELAEPLARSGTYDLVVYGHTHRVDQRHDNGLLLNPGETGGWLTGCSTVAIVDLDNLQVRLHDLQAD
jgi:putative phosphoesterase